MKTWYSRQNILSLLIVVAVMGALMFLIYNFRILNPVNGDFSRHNQYAVRLFQGGKIPVHILAHPLYQILIGALIWISRSVLDTDHASIVLVTASMTICALIFYVWLGRRTDLWSEAVRVFLSISLGIVTPIMLFQPVDGQYYFGYIGLANYHNPTVIMLKPFALIMLIYAVAGIQNRLPAWYHTLAFCLITIGATLLKPSFTLSLFPVVILFILWKLYRKEGWNKKLLLAGLLIPGVVILAAQYLYTYIQKDTGGGLAFAPFAVESMFSGYLGWKFILSVFFPIITVLGMGKKAFVTTENQVAWLAFLLGSIQMYFIAETGNRMDDGNFRWSAQITLFVLFAVMIRSLWQQPKWTWRQIIPLTVGYLPHIVAGVIYYLHCLSAKSYG